MSVKSFAVLCLVLCLPALAAAQSPLRAIAEAALLNDPNRIRAVETLRATEADAMAERQRRLVDGGLTASAGKEIGFGSADTGGASFQGGISASSFLPAGAKLSVGSTYQYALKDAASSSPSGSIKSDTANFSAGLKIPVFANGLPIDPRLSDAARATAIDLPLEAARESASDQERSSVDAALRLALDAASANRACSLAERHAAIAERDAEIARVKREQGTLSFSDLTKIEKDADSSRLSALESRFIRDKKLRALCAATGLDPSTIDLSSIILPDVAPDPAALEGSVVTKDMRRTSRERKTAEMNRVLAGAESAPSLDLSASSSLPGPVSRSQKTWDKDNQGSWTATASVTLPLPSGAGAAKTRAADARLAAARQGEAAAARSGADELSDLRNAWTMALAKIDLRAQLLEQARTRLRDMESSLATETATKLDVERARLSADDAAAALEDDRAAGFRAALDLYQYCGLDPLSLLKEVQS
jgi:outer membrane protein TolC